MAYVVQQQFEAYEETMTAQAGTIRPPYHFPDIDSRHPTSLPTQKQVFRALCIAQLPLISCNALTTPGRLLNCGTSHALFLALVLG